MWGLKEKVHIKSAVPEVLATTMLGRHGMSLPSSLSPASLPPSACEVGGVGNVVLRYRVWRTQILYLGSQVHGCAGTRAQSSQLQLSLSFQLRVGRQPLTPTLPNTHPEPTWGGGGDDEESVSVLRTLHSRVKTPHQTRYIMKLAFHWWKRS